MTLLHGSTDEPQRRHVEKVVYQASVQDHGTEEAVPLPLFDDQRRLLGPHLDQRLRARSDHWVDAQRLDRPAVDAVTRDHHPGAYEQEDVREERTVPTDRACRLEVRPAQVRLLVRSSPCRVLGPFHVQSYPS